MKKLFISFFCLFFFVTAGMSQSIHPQTVKLKPVNIDSLGFLDGLPIWPLGKPNEMLSSKKSVRIGYYIYENVKYRIAIVNSESMKNYSIDSRVWIDENHNNTFDFKEDIFEQIYLPFTFKNSPFKVSSIDPQGSFLDILPLDPSLVPPIGVGLPAPDFESTTIDSVKFNLSDYFGENILLYFFSCNPYTIAPQIKIVSDHFASNKRFKIICVGTYFENSSLPEINWIHINNGKPHYKVRVLYQVGALPTAIFINEDGIIESIDNVVRAESLIQIIETQLNGN